MEAIDYSIGWSAPNRARYSAFASSQKSFRTRHCSWLSAQQFSHSLQHSAHANLPHKQGNDECQVEICLLLEATLSSWTNSVNPLWHCFSKLVSENKNQVRSDLGQNMQTSHTTLLHFRNQKLFLYISANDNELSSQAVYELSSLTVSCTA